MKTLEVCWIALLVVRNLALKLTYFGGIHIYLYNYKQQGDKLRFSNQPFATNNKRFNFGNQVRDNMFRPLGYAVSILTAYEVATYSLLANDVLRFLPIAENSTSFWVWFTFCCSSC